MERLTKRNKDGIAYMAIADRLTRKEQEIEGSKPILEGLYDIWQKLADYEDLGIPPEELKSFLKDFGISIIMRMTNLRKQLDEYKNLEEQGLLIKLPCKVGDIVYESNISRNIISSYRLTSIVVMTGSRNYNWELIEGIYSNLNGFNEFAIGKTIFLTREEAEKALNENSKIKEID